MNKTIPAQKQSIEELLQQTGRYVSTTVGVSMYPMLRNRRDTIVIQPYTGRLKKYDIPLYKREDSYVLHRIVKVLPDSYVICGDNCIQREYGIKEDQIVGVLTAFYRDNRPVDLYGIKYQLYVRVWTGSYPLRKWFRILKEKVLQSHLICQRKERERK